MGIPRQSCVCGDKHIDMFASGNVESGGALEKNNNSKEQKGTTMNKGELIEKIAKDAKISKVQAGNALNSTILLEQN